MRQWISRPTLSRLPLNAGHNFHRLADVRRGVILGVLDRLTVTTVNSLAISSRKSLRIDRPILYSIERSELNTMSNGVPNGSSGEETHTQSQRYLSTRGEDSDVITTL